MTKHIREFVTKVDSSALVSSETRKLLKALTTNILNELNWSNTSSFASANPTYPSLQLQTT
jgi:hypothetical protein